MLSVAAEVMLTNVTTPQQGAEWVHGHLALSTVRTLSTCMLSMLFYDTVDWWEHSVGDRWTNEYEALWNDTGRGKPKYWEKNLSQGTLSTTNPTKWGASNYGSETWCDLIFLNDVPGVVAPEHKPLNSAVNTSGILVQLYLWKLWLDTAHHIVRYWVWHTWFMWLVTGLSLQSPELNLRPVCGILWWTKWLGQILLWLLHSSLHHTTSAAYSVIYCDIVQCQ
jgi:hypothetical protein